MAESCVTGANYHLGVYLIMLVTSKISLARLQSVHDITLQNIMIVNNVIMFTCVWPFM